MLLKSLITGPLEVNCYILGCKKTGEAAVIDPGGNAEEITSLIEELNLKLKWILITHGHFDHTGGLKKLKELTGGIICIHPEDMFLFETGSESALFWGFKIDSPPSPDRLLADSEEIRIGEHKIKVLHTPGHSPGGVCYYTEDKIFVGDVLFSGSIGRTDLPGGDHRTLLNTIKEKLLTLPEETKVYPGHGTSTTISQEIKGNPFLHNI